MNKKQQEEQLRKQEDQALKKGLLWVAGAVVLEMLLFVVSRYAFDFDATAEGVALAETLRTALGALRILALAAFVGGGAMALVKAKGEQGSKWFGVACAAGGAVMVCAHVALKYQSSGLRMLYLLVPVLGGLALSFYIYQREFFLSALPVVVGALGLWFARVGGLGLELIVTLATGIALLAGVALLKKGDGALDLGDKKLQVVPGKGDYTVALTSAAVAVVLQAAALVAGGMVAYYLIFVMGAWLFALLVYYTVKMM